MFIYLPLKPSCWMRIIYAELSVWPGCVFSVPVLLPCASEGSHAFTERRSLFQGSFATVPAPCLVGVTAWCPGSAEIPVAALEWCWPPATLHTVLRTASFYARLPSCQPCSPTFMSVSRVVPRGCLLIFLVTIIL